jgi:hypothetical protein
MSRILLADAMGDGRWGDGVGHGYLDEQEPSHPRICADNLLGDGRMANESKDMIQTRESWVSDAGDEGRRVVFARLPFDLGSANPPVFGDAHVASSVDGECRAGNPSTRVAFLIA